MLNIFEDEMFLSLPLENNGNRAKEVSFISCATKNKRGEVKEARKKFYFQIFNCIFKQIIGLAKKIARAFSFGLSKCGADLKPKAPNLFSLKKILFLHKILASLLRWKNAGRAKCRRCSVLTL